MRQGRTPANVGSGKVAAGSGLPRSMFYVLADAPCPYFPDRRERKLITELDGPDPTRVYSALSRAGFRRSHQFAYRPACADCAACVPVRIAVGEARRRRSHARIWQANAGLGVRERPAEATVEQFELFGRYIRVRHDDGEMAGMSFADYRGMVEHTRIDTRLIEFRDRDGTLVAGCLVDWLDDGPSAVYSFFEPALASRSLGTFVILWLIAEARARGLTYAYLGYWIDRCGKMDYKTRFQPLEAFGPNGWAPMPERQPPSGDN